MNCPSILSPQKRFWRLTDMDFTITAWEAWRNLTGLWLGETVRNRNVPTQMRQSLIFDPLGVERKQPMNPFHCTTWVCRGFQWNNKALKVTLFVTISRAISKFRSWKRSIALQKMLEFCFCCEFLLETS